MKEKLETKKLNGGGLYPTPIPPQGSFNREMNFR